MSDQGFGLTSCQHCGQNVEFPLAGLGLSVACPHCNLETILAEASALTLDAQPGDEIAAAELKAALAGVVPRRRLAIFYQLGLLVVAIFMVFLPVVYLAFAASVAYGTYWYGVHALALFTSFSGGFYGLIFKVILYLGPLLGGAVAVFFMFKPILARRRKRATPIELNPAQHPRLYQFIAPLSELSCFTAIVRL